MRVTIIAVAIIVAAGSLTAVWLLAPPSPPNAASPPTATPQTSSGPHPGATPTSGSENPASGASDAATNRIPRFEPRTPLLVAPLPPDGAATGGLAEGFPADIAGPAPGSDIVTSALAGDGTTLQVTLTARTDESEEAVRAHYLTLWTGLGLSAAPSAGSAVSVADEYSSFTLAFTNGTGTGTVYTVYGVLRTA